MECNFSQEQVDKIINMYKEGQNIDNIIKYFNTNEHNIRFVLKENQIDRVYNTFKKELYDRLIYLYSDCGYTQTKISYELLISTPCIKKRQ